MTVKDLIVQILTQIGYVSDAGSVSSKDSERCRELINSSVLAFNKEDFLHFTKDILLIDANGTNTIIIENPPLKIDRLTFRKNGEVYKVRKTEMSSFVTYLGANTDGVPRAFVYDRLYVDGSLVGRIRLDCANTYDFAAAVTNDFKAFESDSETLCVPPDYAEMIRADVQYRLLANSDASMTLKNSKEYERNKICDGIKKGNFSGITEERCEFYGNHDVILTGRGRL